MFNPETGELACLHKYSCGQWEEVFDLPASWNKFISAWYFNMLLMPKVILFYLCEVYI